VTTQFEVNVQCGACGAKSTQTELGSTNRFGAPDLDLRPPPMMRDTLEVWLQECPRCGACAPDLAELDDSARATVESADYRGQRAARGVPALAIRFLCASLLAHSRGEIRDAGMRALHAAWACDDASDARAAVACRRRAAGLLARVRAAGVGDGAGQDDAILADVYRRAGQFKAAAAACDAGIAAGAVEFLADVLRFQRARADAHDAACYRADQVPTTP
jgi:hypothetical protein